MISGVLLLVFSLLMLLTGFFIGRNEKKEEAELWRQLNIALIHNSNRELGYVE